jgi:LysR family transcriptional regulator, regulator of peptidoglycan recycling
LRSGNRTTRSVAPTEAGEQLLRRLRPVLDEFSAVVDSVNAFRDRPAGQLRLTVPPAVASFVLSPLLKIGSGSKPDRSNPQPRQRAQTARPAK